MYTPKAKSCTVFCVSEKEQEKIEELYRKYEEECVSFIPSELSFFLYDPEKRFYFAVRDIIGLSPLYYTITKKKFFFSDNIGALFQESGITKVPNLQTMRNIIYQRTIPYDATMYKNVKRLPPGHYMKASEDGKYVIVRYWKPDTIKINYKIDELEARERFLALFDRAIFDRIDDLETTGFELSGGLDSSSIVAWVKHKRPNEKITAISMNFKSMKHCNESEYIEAFQKHCHIDIQNINTDRIDYRNKYSLENNYKLNPYWPIFITYTMGFPLIEKAKELGIKTVLTGQGGDQVLSGNAFALHEYFRHFRWIKLYNEIKNLPYPRRMIKNYILFPLIGEKRLQLIKSLLGKTHNQSTRSSNTINELADLYHGKSITFKFDLMEILHTTLSVLMESSYYRVAETNFGIRFKHPYFDRELIEFMLSLPPSFKYSKGEFKVLLRNAMKGILPDEIRLRKNKAEFSEVLRQQINALDLDSLLENAYLARLGLIEQEKLNNYKQAYLSSKMDRIVYFWQLINLEYWYRYNFIEH